MAPVKAKRYTLLGPPEAEQRIHDDQSRITQAVLEVIPRPTFAALILAGGYGRGEGGYRSRNGQFAPYNDYDYFVVLEASRRKSAEWQRRLKKVGHFLEDKIGVEVDFAVLRRSKLSKLEYSLMNAELQWGHRVLAGDDDVLVAMQRMPMDLIPLAEFSRLMLNRGSLLLMNQRALRSNTVSTDADREQFSRYLDKAVLACADARLAAAGRYHGSYPIKLERIKELKWPGGGGFLRDYARALDARFGPESLPVPAGREALAQARVVAHWLEALAELETIRLGQLPGWSDYATARVPKGQSSSGLHGLLRNLFVTLRDFGPAEFLHNPGWAVRYPRERLISILPGLLEPSVGVPIKQLAGTLSKPAIRDHESLAEVFLNYWSHYA